MSQLWSLVRWFWFLLLAMLAKLFAPRRARVAACEEKTPACEDDSEETDEEPAAVNPVHEPADTLDDLPPVPWHEAIDGTKCEDGIGVVEVNGQPSPQPG